MARPSFFTKSLSVAADDDGIAQAQTPVAAGDLTINGALASGGLATLSSNRKVVIASTMAEGRTFTIYGTDRPSKNVISEKIVGTGQSVLDYYEVTRVAVDGATNGAIKVGTNGVGASHWIPVDRNITPVSISLNVTLTGSVNWSIECTIDELIHAALVDPNNSAALIPKTFLHPRLFNQSSDAFDIIDFPITAFRLLISSGTGSARVADLQAGII